MCHLPIEVYSVRRLPFGRETSVFSDGFLLTAKQITDLRHSPGTSRKADKIL